MLSGSFNCHRVSLWSGAWFLTWGSGLPFFLVSFVRWACASILSPFCGVPRLLVEPPCPMCFVSWSHYSSSISAGTLWLRHERLESPRLGGLVLAPPDCFPLHLKILQPRDPLSLESFSDLNFWLWAGRNKHLSSSKRLLTALLPVGIAEPGMAHVHSALAGLWISQEDSIWQLAPSLLAIPVCMCPFQRGETHKTACLSRGPASLGKAGYSCGFVP